LTYLIANSRQNTAKCIYVTAKTEQVLRSIVWRQIDNQNPANFALRIGSKRWANFV